MAVTGNLGDQEIQLDNAAEEATLQRLVDLFDQKFADNSGVKKAEAQAIRESTKATQSTAVASKAYQQTIDNVSGSMEEFEKQTVSLMDRFRSAGAAALSFGRGVGNSLRGIQEDGSGLGGFLKETGEQTSKLAGAIPVVGKALGAAATGITAAGAVLIGSFDKTVAGFTQITQSGASFGGSMIAMRQAATQGGMSFTEFADVISKNSKGLAAFGGGATQGAKAFSEVARAGGDFSRDLLATGLSIKDQKEFFADFMGNMAESGMTIQSFGGDFNRVAATAVKYRKDLQILSEITGQSAEEQQANAKALQQDAAFQAQMATMQPEAASALKAVMQNLGPMGRQMLKDQVTLGTFGEKSALAASQQGGIAATITEVAQALKNGETDLTSVLASGLDARAGQIKREQAAADQQAAISGSVNNEVLSSIAASANEFRKMSALAGSATQNVQKVVESQAKVAEGGNKEVNLVTERSIAFRKVMQRTEEAMYNLALDPNGPVPAVIEGMTKLGDAVAGAIKKVGEVASGQASPLDLVGGPIGATAIGGALAAATVAGIVAKKAAFSVLANALPRNARPAAAADMVPDAQRSAPAQPTRSQQPSRAASAQPSRAAPTQPTRSAPAQPSRAAGGASRGARGGGAITRVLGGLGRGAGAIISALGDALAKLGPKAPLMAAGAAGVGAAITAIGAGIAGAAWLTGKALPTFSDGLKSLEEVNGDALIQAGKGMAAVAAGMAAFGVGSAVAGLGSLVGSITSGISNLFGGDDPLKQLATFSITPINAAGVKSNAEAMVAFSQAMAAAGGGTAAAGIGSLVGNITSGISSFFGGDSPLEKVQKFGEQEINTAGVVANANALTVFAESMSKITGANLESTAISDMSSGIRQLSASLRTLDTTKLEALSDFMRSQAEKVTVPDVTDQSQEQDPAEVGQAAMDNSAVTLAEVQKTNTLLEKMLDLQNRTLPDQTDTLARMSYNF